MHEPPGNSRSTLMHRLRLAALSGGASGAGLGAIHAAMSPGSTVGSIGASALKSALLGGAAAPAGLAAGEAILGSPKPGEANPSTHRGLIGGATLGAGAGGLAALYLASGRKIPLTKLGSLGEKIESKAAGFMGADNLIANKLRSWATNPSASNLAKAALLGGGAAGVAGGSFSAGEGEESDILNNEAEALQRKRHMRAMGAQYGS